MSNEIKALLYTILVIVIMTAVVSLIVLLAVIFNPIMVLVGITVIIFFGVLYAQILIHLDGFSNI